MAKKIPCPNCLEPAEKIGNKIICQACDSTFVITKTGAAKVKDIGWKEKIEERLSLLEVGQADEESMDDNQADAYGETAADDESFDLLPR